MQDEQVAPLELQEGWLTVSYKQVAPNRAKTAVRTFVLMFVQNIVQYPMQMILQKAMQK